MLYDANLNGGNTTHQSSVNKSDCGAVSTKPSKLLTKEQEYDLARKAASGDIKARNDLVSANYGLVAKVVRGYVNSGQPFEELYQEGCIGLIIAAGKFNVEKNCRFSTYATIWIKKYIMKASIRSGFSNNIPRRIEPYVNKVMSFYQRFQITNDREATAAEIAEGINIPIDIVRDVLRFCNRLSEYNEYSVYHEGNTTFCSTEEECIINSLLQQDINEILNRALTPQERYVIKMLHLNNVPVTKKELSIQLHITVSQIRVLERKAFEKIKQYFVSNKIDIYDYLDG